MIESFTRTKMLIGAERQTLLEKARVAVFGAGGVGSYTIEALARSGIGRIDIIDGDVISVTNINRQIIALENTVGMQKAELAKRRVTAINSRADARAYPLFFTADTAHEIPFQEYHYIVDAIDTVTSKLLLISYAKAAGVPVISSMGTGNKLNPLMFKIADISQTSICPLARVMRKELKKLEISGVKVLYSTEEPLTPEAAEQGEQKGTAGRPVPGSVPFVPSVAGLLIAGEVFKDLTGLH